MSTWLRSSKYQFCFRFFCHLNQPMTPKNFSLWHRMIIPINIRWKPFPQFLTMHDFGKPRWGVAYVLCWPIAKRLRTRMIWWHVVGIHKPMVIMVTFSEYHPSFMLNFYYVHILNGDANLEITLIRFFIKELFFLFLITASKNINKYAILVLDNLQLLNKILCMFRLKFPLSLVILFCWGKENAPYHFKLSGSKENALGGVPKTFIRSS